MLLKQIPKKLAAWKNQKKSRIPDSSFIKTRKSLCFIGYAAAIVFCCFPTVVWGESDPLGVVNNLSGFIFSLIRAIGLILLGWGVVQVGLSFQSHDPSQRSQGFLTLAGGLVVTFAKEILDLITT